MTQQVNLYQPILRREKKVFSASTMLQVLVAITALMLVMFGAGRWQLENLQDESERLHAQEAALAERVGALSRDLRAQPESRELRQAVETARRELELKQRLANLMESRGEPRDVGFAEAFAGLARQRIAGLWLTGVTLANVDGQRQVTLSGLTSKAELVPELVQQLGQERSFQGVRFHRMKVFQPEEGPGNALAFRLTTQPVEEQAP